MQPMRIFPNRSALAAALAMAVFATSLPLAYAQTKDEVDPRVSEAMSACLGNNLDKGIGILAQLYAETQDAIWVFNQARCYQQNNKLEDARTRFLEFRRKNRNKDKARDARAQEYLAEIDKELERRERNAARAEAPKKTVEPPKAEAPVPQPKVPAYVPPAAAAESSMTDLSAAQTARDAEAPNAPIYSRWWFWTAIAGVAVASAITIAVASSGTTVIKDCGEHPCVPLKD